MCLKCNLPSQPQGQPSQKVTEHVPMRALLNLANLVTKSSYVRTSVNEDFLPWNTSASAGREQRACSLEGEGKEGEGAEVGVHYRKERETKSR